MIEDVSCIRFQPQSEVRHKDYIEFIAGRGCWSQVGRKLVAPDMENKKYICVKNVLKLELT